MPTPIIKEVDLRKINQAIGQKKLKWVAGDTELSRRPLETKRKMLLPALPVPEKALIDKLTCPLPPMPNTLDWRNVGGKNFVTSIKDQGNDPVCIAFAVTATLESCLLRTLEPYFPSITPIRDVVDLSERVLISCNSKYPCSAEFVISTGLPPEECHPYVPGNVGSPSVGWQLKTVRAEQHTGYKDLSIDEFKALLLLIGPIATGMNVPWDFFSYTNGIYSIAISASAGFHLVSVIGFDDLEECFIVKNSWGQSWGEQGFFRIAYSMFGEGTVVEFGRLTDAFSGTILSSPTTIPISLRTCDGHYVTVVNGGGLGGANNGPGAVALHTDATKVGPWETFEIVWIDPTHFGIKTVNGNFVTAINGGGIGGPNDNTSPIHTDATNSGPRESLLLNYDFSSARATFRTLNGHFLTAVNGGGFGGPNNVPIHTDATALGPWETFTLELGR